MLKGKTEAVEVWEPLHDDDPREAFMARYCEAYEALKSGDPGAKAMFAALAREAPDDPCVASISNGSMRAKPARSSSMDGEMNHLSFRPRHDSDGVGGMLSAGACVR